MKIFKWHPIRKRRQEKLNQVRRLVFDIVHDIRDRPLTVTHKVIRNIPKPAHAMIIARNTRGEEYRHHVDMSYKSGFPVTFPLYFFTQRDADHGIPVEIRIDLGYDPRLG